MFELLAIVGVDKEKRVFCGCKGCKKTVYVKIHIVRKGGKIIILGSTCFKKEYGEYRKQVPKFSYDAQRKLTDEERMLLIKNTEKLIEKFESEMPPPVEIQIEQPKVFRPSQSLVFTRTVVSKTKSNYSRIVKCHYCNKPMSTALMTVPAKGFKCDHCKSTNASLPIRR